MKVVEINSFCNGSTGRIACDIARQLIKEDNDCVLAFGRGNSIADMQTIKIGNKLSNYFHVFITRVFDRHGFGSKIATKKLVKKLKQYNPDVVHLHNIHGYYINIKILFKYLKESNKKVVWTLHDCWTMTGHCSHFESTKCDKWKNRCFNCKLKKDYPKTNIFSNACKNYKNKHEIFTSLESNQLTIVTPSYWLANIVKQSYLSKYKVQVINNGIDTSIFKKVESDIKEKYHIEDKKVILGVASVWTDKKGFNDFIKLSKIINDKYQVVLIGVNENQIKELPKNILGIKRTENIQELVKWYSCSEVFLNLTYEDTYPTVNLEAQACGTPVITYNTGGSIESCCSENIVEKGDLKKIVEILNIKDRKIYSNIIDKNESVNKYIKLMKGE